MPIASDRWQPPADAVDPALIPQRILYTGAKMPAIGLGTFGSDHVSHQAVADAVKSAAAIGYGILIAPPFMEMSI